MKTIKLFNEFTNESLDASAKVTAKEVDELKKLIQKDDLHNFMEEFAQTYGSACEIWMNADDRNKLAELYAKGTYDFVALSGGDEEDGAEDSKMKSYLRKGWKLLADEQNDDSYDSVLYKKKK